MTKPFKPQTTAAYLENCSNVRIGSITTDADNALISKSTHNLYVGEIKQFTKTNTEIDKLFNRINQYIDIEEGICDQDKNTTKKLASDLKSSYLQRDSKGFKVNYDKFTSFMSNHLTIYTYLTTTISTLIQNL